MSLTEVVIEGTLKPDGTLELNEKPNLSPGRVTVVLRQESLSAPPQEDWFQFMQNARNKMEQAGCHFMDEKEIHAHVERLREADRIDDLLRESRMLEKR
jgi:hypothetical protein